MRVRIGIRTAFISTVLLLSLYLALATFANVKLPDVNSGRGSLELNASQTPNTQLQSIHIDIRDHGPIPNITIAMVDQPVVWTNKGSIGHTITEGEPMFRTYLPTLATGYLDNDRVTTNSNNYKTISDPLFESGWLKLGEQFSFTFTTSGTHKYYSEATPDKVVGEIIILSASEMTRGVVSASQGGLISSDDGVSISVAPNSLYTDTEIILRKADQVPERNTIGIPVGPAYQLDLQFSNIISSPITVTLPYTSSLLPEQQDEDELQAAYFNGLSWIQVPSNVDENRDLITFNTTHLSFWMVFRPSCDLIVGNALFSEGEVESYSEAQDYLRILSEHKDLFESFRTSQINQSVPLFTVHHDEAEWLAQRDLCQLSNTPIEEIEDGLKIPVSHWSDVAYAMVDIGNALKNKQYDHEAAQRMAERITQPIEVVMFTLHVVSYATTGGPLSHLAREILLGFIFDTFIYPIEILAYDFHLSIQVKQNIGQMKDLLRSPNAWDVGVSGMDNVAGYLEPSNCGIRVNYDDEHSFYLLDIPGYDSDKAKGFINIYHHAGLGIPYPWYEGPGVEQEFLVVGLQEMSQFKPIIDLYSHRYVYILAEYKDSDNNLRVNRLLFENTKSIATDICMAGAVSMPGIAEGSDIQITYYFIENGHLDKDLGLAGVFTPIPDGQRLCYRDCIETDINHPPGEPKLISPAHDATDIDVDSLLMWIGSDPDGDYLTYDVLVGTGSNLPENLVCDDVPHTYCAYAGYFSYDTHYSWQVIAEDQLGEKTLGPIWEFTTSTSPNQPPFEPSTPTPDDGAPRVSINALLSWTGGDPDLGDTVYYDVYLDANNSIPTTLRCNDVIDSTVCDPGTLEFDTHYYWRVIARDEHGETTEGEVWDFTTVSNVHEVCGSISADDTWESAYLYRITCPITITVGTTLTVEAGVTVESASGDGLVVNGILNAIGTESSPVTFTSGQATKAPGDWSGIQFNPNSDGNLHNTIVEYGGEVGVFYASPTISSSTFRYFQGSALNVGGSSSPRIISNTISTNSGGIHLGLLDNQGEPYLEENTFLNNANYSIEIYASKVSLSIGPGNTYSGNGFDGITVRGNELDGSHVWNAWMNDFPLRIESSISITQTGTLTIEEGLELQFLNQGPRGTDLEIYGTLNATGTALSPVTFTSALASPQFGDWAGIYFRPGSGGALVEGIIEYSEFSIQIESASPTIRDCVIVNNGSSGVNVVEIGGPASPQLIDNYIEVNIGGLGVDLYHVVEGLPSLSGNTISGATGAAVRVAADKVSSALGPGNSYTSNGFNGVYVLGNEMAGAHTWQAHLGDYPLQVHGAVTVTQTATLTIEEGIELQFLRAFGGTSGLRVSGRLFAVGTSSSPIKFTSSSEVPTPAADWDGINYLIGSSGNISYAIIEYGSGIQLSSETVTVTNITSRYNQFGLVIAANNITANNNNLYSNTYGATSLSSLHLADLRNNWWGSTSGPFHPALNPDGTGNSVSDEIVFDPWLTAPVAPG